MTEHGEFIHGRYGSDFTFSLMTEKQILQPGKYIVMIDPMWNSSSSNSKFYREILIDIYCPESVTIGTIGDTRGMQYLAKAFKHHAKTMSPPESRENYLTDNPDYGEDVLRV